MEHEERYEFGRFCLDVTAGRLVSDDELVPLTPKAFDTLVALVRRHDRLVGKRELMNLLWPDTIVEEANLTQQIFVIRKTLGEQRNGRPFIETVPRRGYRFEAPVRRLSAATSDPGAGLRRRVAWGLAITLAVGGVIVIRQIAFLRSSTLFAGATPAPNMRVVPLSTDGTVWTAAISRDGHQVAYALDDGKSKSLWSLDLSSWRRSQLVPPDANAYDELTFSPDGHWIYFVRGAALFRVPATGGAAQHLLDGVMGRPSMSPDGRRLALIRPSPTTAPNDLLLANADGSDSRSLAVRLPGRLHRVAWSPDAASLACTVITSVSPAVMRLGRIDLATGAFAFVGAREWSSIGTLDWLSDGSGVVIAAIETSASAAQHLWSVAYPSGDARVITSGLSGYSGVSVAGDGHSLVTVSTTARFNLWVLTPADLSRARPITSGEAYDDLPAWTADGRIVYESRASGNRDLWIIDADGSNRRQLTFDPHVDTSPVVSPDGRTIVFTSDRNGTHLWAMDLSGGQLRRLTNGTGEVSAAFSPDGRWIFYEAIGGTRPVIERIAIDGGVPVAVTDRLSRAPAVSPDGRLLAAYYWDEGPASPTGIAILPFAGLRPIAFFPHVREALGPPHPRWTQTNAISYVTTTDGVSNIFSQPIGGGPPRAETAFSSDRISTFDWSRDGRLLVCSRGPMLRDVVLVQQFR